MRRVLRALRRDGLLSGLRRAASAVAGRVSTRLRHQNERALIRASGLFDADFYASRVPDVRAAGIDPLRHFVAAGWQQGRDPHPLFDLAYYLRANPDVARLGVNPLVHYLT